MLNFCRSVLQCWTPAAALPVHAQQTGDAVVNSSLRRQHYNGTFASFRDIRLSPYEILWSTSRSAVLALIPLSMEIRFSAFSARSQGPSRPFHKLCVEEQGFLHNNFGSHTTYSCCYSSVRTRQELQCRHTHTQALSLKHVRIHTQSRQNLVRTHDCQLGKHVPI